MGTFIIHLLSGFITTVCFGMLYDVPKKLLGPAGLAGAAGYIVYFMLLNYFKMTSFFSMTVASFTIGFLGHIFARKLRTPVILFTMPGIIPLVPGATAYNMMRLFIEGNTNSGIGYGTETLLVAGALALGLAMNSALFQILTSRNLFKRGRRFLP